MEDEAQRWMQTLNHLMPGRSAMRWCGGARPVSRVASSSETRTALWLWGRARPRAALHGELLDLLVDLDHHAIRATGELRWAPATVVLALVSAWWVKGPLLVAVGCCADLRSGRRFPLVALAATASFFVASGLNAVLKALVDRSRPPEAIGLDALIGVPGSPSFPRGMR